VPPFDPGTTAESNLASTVGVPPESSVILDMANRTIPYRFDGQADWEALARYLAGESNPQEAAEIQRWLAEDPSRAAALAELDRLLTPKRVAPTVPVDVEGALERVRSRLEEPVVHSLAARKSAPEPQARSTAWVLARRAAAVAALLVGPALVYTMVSVDREEAALANVVHTTSTGERDSLTLADGTRVLLGPATELTVLAGYGDDVRELRLVGEAMFQVEHDAGRPFVVQVPGAAIEDLGTAFSVRTGSEQGVRVVVTEGSVRLRPAGGQPDDGVVLREGDLGTLAAGSEPAVQRGAATADDLSWTRGVLTFRDATISEVRSELRRWFGIELRLRDPGFADRHLTATFQDESVEQVANVIALALGGRAEVRADTAIIHPLEEPR
jgi:transmembrane sensor